MEESLHHKGVGSSHSKLILIGEHAVVYNKPAIALPFMEVEATSFVEGTNGEITVISNFYHGPLNQIPQKMLGLKKLIHETLVRLNKLDDGFILTINSSIPIGRGLGSSAAIAIAIVRSIYHYYHVSLTNNELLSLVHVAETYAHGNPSGIDMQAACNDHPIWFEKNQHIDSLQINGQFHLVIADSGNLGDTITAVNSIKEKYQLQPKDTQMSLDLIEHNTYQARDALFMGNAALLGKTMNVAQEELTKLGVSDESIDNLVSVAQNCGALGAKLTGGGRGGCVIALAKNDEHATTMADAWLSNGAVKTWQFQIGQ